MDTDGWIPNGGSYQGKYFHLSSLYAGFTFTYFFKTSYMFSGAGESVEHTDVAVILGLHPLIYKKPYL